MKDEKENSRFLLPSAKGLKDSNNRLRQKCWQLPRLAILCNLLAISLFLSITTITNTNTDALATTDLHQDGDLNSTKNITTSIDESQPNNNSTSYLRVGKQDSGEKDYNNNFDQPSPTFSSVNPYYPYSTSSYSSALDPYSYYSYFPYLQQYPSLPPFIPSSSTSSPSSPYSTQSLSPFSSSYNPRGFPLPPPPPPLAVPVNLFQFPQNPYGISERPPELHHHQQQHNLLFKSSTEQEAEQYPKLLSQWFPSLPASDCQGVFEFTIEGMANLDGKKIESGDHKITLKLSSKSPDFMSGKLWVDRKNSQDKGHEFEIKETFNNCRVVTASSSPESSKFQSEDPITSSLFTSDNSISSALPSEDQEDLSFSEIKDEEETRDQNGNNNNNGNRDDEDSGKTIAALE